MAGAGKVPDAPAWDGTRPTPPHWSRKVSPLAPATVAASKQRKPLSKRVCSAPNTPQRSALNARGPAAKRTELTPLARQTRKRLLTPIPHVDTSRRRTLPLYPSRHFLISVLNVEWMSAVAAREGLAVVFWSVRLQRQRHLGAPLGRLQLL